MDYFNSVYQITQECPFRCPFCLRLYASNHRSLTSDERRQMVQILKARGLKRLSISGGEPTVLGDELFDFMKYVHDQQIHVCLSSTGFRLTEDRVQEMDGYVDQMLISMHSAERGHWLADFGDTKHTLELYDTVHNLLGWIKYTGIILEVNTVVHRENIDSVPDLGWKLAEMNPNIVWRIDEYYGTGKEAARRDRFELEPGRFETLCEGLERTFKTLFYRVRFREQTTRSTARDLMISPTGDFMTSSDYTYTSTGHHVLNAMPETFENFHPWKEYKKACRDWGWNDHPDES